MGYCNQAKLLILREADGDFASTNRLFSLGILVTSLVLGVTRRSKEAILTADRVFHWLTPGR
jgi:hypothetical protein